MSAKKQKTRPAGKPIPVRFPDEVLSRIDQVGQDYGLSRSDTIRLATQAGLLAMEALGVEGLVQRIAEEITGPGDPPTRT